MSQNENININTKIEIDPDYKSTNAAIRNVEIKVEEDKQLTEEKAKNVFQEIFDENLQGRQKQLEEIEEKIFKAQKLLHVVRYGLVSSYYNTRALEYETEGSNSLEYTNILTGQNRIHPAVKKLLGTNVDNFKFLTGRSKRRIPEKSDQNVTEQPEPKKAKLEIEVPKQEVSIENIKIEQFKPTVEQEIATQRKKIQHKVVIGNISYFKKSLEQDNLTHKWMVYVKIFKGSKDGLDVSTIIISKVIFYLHPSYKPHDVVEVSHPPFHLSRRGWGEFPLRVQVFFNSTRNKPVDIIHNLKLDKTFTERQTLGNETVETVFLYDDTVSDKSNSILQSTVVFDVDNIKQEPSTSLEHDYCYETVSSNRTNRENLYNCKIPDHTYCLDSQAIAIKKQKKSVDQPYNELIYGLGANYLEPNKNRTRRLRAKSNHSPEKNQKNVFKVLKTVTGQSIKFLPESFSQILLGNGNIVSVKFLKQQLPCKISNATKSETGNNLRDAIRQEKYLLKLPHNKFSSMGEALPYLYRRLPLWTSKAEDVGYKCCYPFSACSKQEYDSWNIGKRLSSEWSRAKTIKRILSGESYSRQWTTKTIFMYGRSHLYVPPVPSYNLFRNKSIEKHLIQNCFITNVQNGHPSSRQTENNEETVNILSSPTKSKEPYVLPKSFIDVSDKTLTQECAYIKESALDVGVVLKGEEMAPGVIMNASERVLLEAVRCFAENMLRRSRNFLVCKGDYNENMEITTDEIKEALQERKEFHSINKFRENKLTMDFFS